MEDQKHSDAWDWHEFVHANSKELKRLIGNAEDEKLYWTHEIACEVAELCRHAGSIGYDIAKEKIKPW